MEFSGALESFIRFLEQDQCDKSFISQNLSRLTREFQHSNIYSMLSHGSYTHCVKGGPFNVCVIYGKECLFIYFSCARKLGKQIFVQHYFLLSSFEVKD